MENKMNFSFEFIEFTAEHEMNGKENFASNFYVTKMVMNYDRLFCLQIDLGNTSSLKDACSLRFY